MKRLYKKGHMRKLIKIILYNSLIGLSICIWYHPDQNLINLSGTISGESKSMITIQSTDRTINISKLNGIYEISNTEISFKITGNMLYGMERARKKRKYRNW